MKKTNIITPASRNDLRIMRLRMDMGLKGYAVYCLTHEFLAERGGSCPTADYPLMAFDFRAEAEDVRRVCEDYALFTIADGMVSISAAGDGGDREETKQPSPAAPDAPKAPELKAGITRRITKRQEKKGKENSPLHPLIRKDKEKDNREERKEISVSCNSEETGSGSECTNAESSEGSEFYTRFRRYWNMMIERTGSRLRPISIMNASRRRQLDRLRREYTDNQISWFIYRACSSPYLNARDGRLRRPADLNWMLISEERIVKISRGTCKAEA